MARKKKAKRKGKKKGKRLSFRGMIKYMPCRDAKGRFARINLCKK